MRKLLITITVAAMTMAAVATGHAQRGGGPAGDDAGPVARQGGPGGRPGGGGPGFRQMRGRLNGGRLGGLDLTDEQRTQTRALILKARDQAAPLVDQLQLARKDLRRAIFADKRDSGAVKDLTGKVARLRQQIADIRLEARTAMAALLTPEQRQQMRARPMRPGGAGPRGSRRGRPLAG